MKFIDYFKDRAFTFIISISLLFISLLILNALNVATFAIVYMAILNVIGILAFFFMDFYKKKKYYDKLKESLENLDKKFLISEMIEKADFIEGEILYDILQEACKSMTDNVMGYAKNIDEYKEYLEIWMHEIKTPIASTKLIIENNNSEVTESVGEEIAKVEGYLEQILFYSKSNALEKDYIIRKIILKDSINKVIRRNANLLIESKIKIILEEVDKYVYCDSKWVEFIIQQIIANSIKYMEKSEKILKIYCEEKKDSIILNICDNGIGMSSESVKRAFEKGYTGENGRRYANSTGFGLYLCKTLCDKLGNDIEVQSTIGEGTKVILTFPSARE